MKIVDMHCDTIYEIYDRYKNGKDCELKRNTLNIDINKMKQGNYLLQNFAMFTPIEQVEDPIRHVQHLIDAFYIEMDKNQDSIVVVQSYEDIQRAVLEDKMCALLTLEEGAVVNDDLSFLRNYYRLGVRMITLTWNYKTSIGCPNFDMSESRGYNTCDCENGLSDFGIQYIKECERLGIIIDVSHLSDAGFYDVLKETTMPFVASHSNARGVCDHARNMSDDMILKLKERGGVMGINFAAGFLSEETKRSRIDDMVKHILYIKDLAGIEVIGLGSDFDGIPQNLELKDASMMPLLVDALKEAGLSHQEIECICYKNVLNLYKKVLK